jgi:hypothetical protein
MQAGQLNHHLQTTMKESLEMTRLNQTPKSGETTAYFFSLRISSQTNSILIILSLAVAVRCTAQTESSNILMPSSVSTSPSVNLETVVVLSSGLGPGQSSSASLGFQGRCNRLP